MNIHIVPRAEEPAEPAATRAAEAVGDRAMFDSVLHALQGRLSGGLSMVAQAQALLDWQIHLANAPFRRGELAVAGARQAGRFAESMISGKPALVPKPNDYRFRHPAWQAAAFQRLRAGISAC